MARASVFEVVYDTSLFTPLQLQPRSLLSLAFSGWAQWLKQHLVSFPRMIREHHCSVVIVGVECEYLAPFGFFDADSLQVVTTVKARKGGHLLACNNDFIGADKTVATVRWLLRPVLLIDEVSLAATPGKLTDELLARFQADEIDFESPPRLVPRAVETILAQGTVLEEGQLPFVIHRHFCELADQWCFVDVASHIGAARETLVLSRGEHSPDLREGLGKPLRKIEFELNRPYFLADGGIVATTAYRLDNALAFVHRLLSSSGTDVHGTAVELIQNAD